MTDELEDCGEENCSIPKALCIIFELLLCGIYQYFTGLSFGCLHLSNCVRNVPF
jgi:hypothetical protein